MMKQKDISRFLGVTPAYVSQLLSGERPVSFPMALKLSKIFNEKDLEAWKNAPPEDIRSAFNKQEMDL